MGQGIIFLMWELGQPRRMFPQTLTLAHFLLERGGFSELSLPAARVWSRSYRAPAAPPVPRLVKCEGGGPLTVSLTQRSREEK